MSSLRRAHITKKHSAIRQAHKNQAFVLTSNFFCNKYSKLDESVMLHSNSDFVINGEEVQAHLGKLTT